MRKFAWLLRKFACKSRVDRQRGEESLFVHSFKRTEGFYLDHWCKYTQSGHGKIKSMNQRFNSSSFVFIDEKEVYENRSHILPFYL